MALSKYSRDDLLAVIDYLDTLFEFETSRVKVNRSDRAEEIVRYLEGDGVGPGPKRRSLSDRLAGNLQVEER